MEMTIEEFNSLTSTPAHPAASVFAHHLIGKQVLVRTRVSGVSVGVLRSTSATPAGFEVVLDDGVRVWSWEGALACSTLAVKGPETVKGEPHPDGVVIADEGMEIHPVTDTAWERFDAAR